MHELPITENLLKLALQYANGANAKRITNLYLVIGDLSSVVDDSVEFYWAIVSKGTIAEDSKLHFERVPAKMHCNRCDIDFTPPDNEYRCPECGEMNVKITGGDEFRLDAIDVE